MDRRELTIRGIILGILITAFFTAANVYLGLKVGLTFASSIPAAVISMAVLQAFRGATIHENNIVQTVASSAGALSAIIFVLPGLVIVGWWSGFPFWMTFGICALEGVLGVMCSIPLRRALVSQSSLPYPEGVAAAQVLKVGVGSRIGQAEDRAGLLTIVASAVASAVFAALVGAKVFAGEIAAWLGPAFDAELSLVPDLDAVEALAVERESLWRRVSAATFLDDDEKRAAVGYGPRTVPG